MGLRIGPPPVLGGDPTLNDSETNAMLKAHAYFAQTPGFVDAYTTGEIVLQLDGYVDNTVDPAGVGDHIEHDRHSTTNDDNNIHFFVQKGWYFEVTSDGVPTIYWTPLMRGGPPPIDFN